MSQTVSASTGAAYGVERVCLVWESGSLDLLRSS